MLNLVIAMLLSAPVEPATFVVEPRNVLDPVRRTVLGVNGPDKYLDWTKYPFVGPRLREGGFGAVRMGPIQDGIYQGSDLYPAAGTWRLEGLDRKLRIIFDAGAEPIFGVIGFPKGVPHALAEKKIVSADWQEYARFMAGVVRHINVEGALGKGRRVKYWEMWNEPMIEPDGEFTSREQYRDFVRTVGTAMKAVDPSIRLIGPVDPWSDLSEGGLSAWTVKEMGDLIDVICWHDYGGQSTQSDTERMRWPIEHYGANPRHVVGPTPDPWFVGSGNRRFGAAITEYNMSWDGQPESHVAKYHTAYNSAFVGAALCQALGSGIELFCFYTLMQEGKNNLGLVDLATGEPYSPFYALRLFSRYMGTEQVKVTGTSDGISTIATRGKTLCVFIVNTSVDTSKSVTLRFSDTPDATTVRLFRVAEGNNGDQSTLLRLKKGRLTTSLPPLSVSAFEVSSSLDSLQPR